MGQERENWEQELRNWEKERKQAEGKLTAKIASLEKSKAEIQKEILIQKEAEKNQLRDKVNKKLEKGGLFKPNGRGRTLEEATDNLLEKQVNLENNASNLEKDIQQFSQQLNEEKEKHANERLQLKNRIDKIISEKNAWFNYKSRNLDEAIDKLFSNQKHIQSTGDKCLNVVSAPFKWVSSKVGTGLALTGFLTAIPVICGSLGWILKAWLSVKTGGVAGAFTVANDMINRNNNQGGNLPPNYQPLPPAQNNYSPPAENIQNLPPVINNHYHNLPEGNRENNRRKKKKKRTDNF